MKKSIITIIMCVLFFMFSFSANVIGQESTEDIVYTIEFNGVSTEYTAFMENEDCYVPMRKIFEMLGGAVFYRSRDSRVLALSRDGDVIDHAIGTNEITVNGEVKTSENPSVFKNNETFIPIDMLSASFAPDGIFLNGEKLTIVKQVLNLSYHPSICAVLSGCKIPGFYPEKFCEYIDYFRLRPDLNIQEVICNVNLGLDAPFYEDIADVENPYDTMVLVNKYNKLPADFTPHNLINMNRKYTSNDGKQYLLTNTANIMYEKMAEAALSEGMLLKVVSAYRTGEYQRGLYNNSVRRNGKLYADNYSARAGHSEHQTGLAVDINSTEGVFAYTREFRWLQVHAHEYGFIMRYPKGKEWITGYAYEPWHYRFVGIDAAKKIYEEGITYEEYYVKYVVPSEYK